MTIAVGIQKDNFQKQITQNKGFIEIIQFLLEINRKLY